MNRRDLVRISVGLGIVASQMPLSAQAQVTTPTPENLEQMLRSLGSKLQLDAPIPAAAIAAYDGVLPTGLTAMTAIAMIAGDDASAEKLPSAMAFAIHDWYAQESPRGALVGGLGNLRVRTLPTGADEFALYDFSVGEGRVAVTVVRVGRWFQALTGPFTVNNLDDNDETEPLFNVVATSMTHWGDQSGSEDPITALPTEDDFSGDVRITVPPVSLSDLPTS